MVHDVRTTLFVYNLLIYCIIYQTHTVHLCTNASLGHPFNSSVGGEDITSSSTSSCSVQEACVLCVGGCINRHDWLSATIYVPDWVESRLQEFGAAFVYALDRHSHGGSLSVLGPFTGGILAAGIWCCIRVCAG